MLDNLDIHNYFINELEDGQTFKVCFMTKDQTRYLLNGFNRYSACSIERYESLPDFIFKNNNGYFRNEYMGQNYSDYDLIILDDYDFKTLKWKLKYLQKMTTKISSIFEKKITIGYACDLPYDMRTKDDKRHLKILIYDSGEKIVDEEIPIKNGHVLDLLDMLSYKHNNVKESKILKK